MAAIQRFLAIVGSLRSEVIPAIAGGVGSAGQLVALDGTTGLLPNSMMPVNIGPDAQALPATETITGPLVNIYSATGTPSIRNADGSVAGKEANAFVLGAVANAATAEVYASGLIPGLTGLTIGPVYLSDTTPGAVSSTPAATAGHVYQRVGSATSTTTVFATFGEPITRA
jgi:hypothetical protein